MANTEGMVDEEMMQMMHQLTTSSSSSATNNTNKRTNRRSRFLQNRSKPQKERQTVTPVPIPTTSNVFVTPKQPNDFIPQTPTNTTNTNNNNGNDNISRVPGLRQDCVMERDPTIMRISSDNNSKNNSLFAKNKMKNKSPTIIQKSGFPTLDIPIGQLTNKRNTKNTSNNPTKDQIMNHSTDANNSSAAQELLNQMSPEEIQQSVQELKQILSPATIDFLRQRRQQQQQQQQQQQPEEMKKTDKYKKQMNQNMNHDEKEKKEEMARLLSSIQTEEELDQLFAQQYPSALLQTKEEGQENELEKVTILLRSTSIRQRVFATKRVYELLSSSSQQSQQKLPPLLPVSLRYLLDDTTNNISTSGYLLQSYALRALEQLLVILLDASSSNYSQLVHIYTNYYLQDHSIPGMIPDTKKQNIVVAESNTNNGNGKEYGQVLLQQNVSSETSSKDAIAFYKDPCGTLLTRMKIIPRLSQLLSNTTMAEGSWNAICRIFQYLCQRSPGVATVMVNHPTIFQLLLHKLHPSSTTTTTTTRIAILQLFCTMARVSRNAATCLAQKQHDLFLPLLLMSEDHEETISSTSLILWRTLLSYGLSVCSELVQSMISQHSSSPFCKKKSLSNGYISCFTKICQLVKVLTPASTNEQMMKSLFSSSMNEETTTCLAMSGMWLSSTVLQCVNNLIANSTATTGEGDLQSMAVQLQFVYR